MRHSRRALSFLLRSLLAISFFAGAAGPARAQSTPQLPPAWNDAVYALAEKIAAALTPPHTLSLDVKDNSSAVPVDLAVVRQGLEADIAARGGRVAAVASAESDVQVTISQNAEGYLIVAIVHHGDSQQIFIVPITGSEASSPQPTPEPGIQRKIVWRQSRQILDFAQATADASHTVWYLLEPDRLESYVFAGGEEVVRLARPLPRSSPSRDPRGRLLLTDAIHFEALIGSFRCDGPRSPTLVIECHENSAQQWPIGSVTARLEPARNYFSGRMSFSGGGEAKFPAFYSAAALSPDTGGQGTSQWVLAGIDGQAQLFAGAPEPLETFVGWGSDILSIAPACGSGWQVLVSGAGDWTQPDRLQLYEIRDRRATAIGRPLEFPGPILTLWSSADGESARVVSRNLQTGLYEASIVSVSCGN
jgi:hypothetical protein